MTTNWVDFKAVKAAVSMEMILSRYEINNLSGRRDELHGPCPIHKSHRRSKNFTVSTSKNAFKCFSSECGAHGNVLDFVAAMEKCSIREAAVKLNEWFKIEEGGLADNAGQDEVVTVPRGVYRSGTGLLVEVVAKARHVENQSDLVIYRELSGDYRYWAGPLAAFVQTDPQGETSDFTLLRTL